MGNPIRLRARNKKERNPIKLPTEVEIYVNNDGSVTFADLAAEMLPVVSTLNPDQPLSCDIPQPAEGTSEQ